jgi:hypothetical protein
MASNGGNNFAWIHWASCEHTASSVTPSHLELKLSAWSLQQQRTCALAVGQHLIDVVSHI